MEERSGKRLAPARRVSARVLGGIMDVVPNHKVKNRVK